MLEIAYLLCSVGAGFAYWFHASHREAGRYEMERQNRKNILTELFNRYSKNDAIIWSRVIALLPDLKQEQIEAEIIDAFPGESQALENAAWITGMLLPANLPKNMVLTAIAEASDGNSSIVYLGLTYATGLPTTELSVNSLVDLVFTSSNGVQVWSRNLGKPIWVIDGVNLSGRLSNSGKEKLKYILRASDYKKTAGSARQVREIEFTFPLDQSEEKKGEKTYTVYDDSRVLSSVNALNEWIHMVVTSQKTGGGLQ